MTIERFPDRSIKVNGNVLAPFVEDGVRFYPLSQLKECLGNSSDAEINSIIRRRSFLDNVSLMTGKHLRKTPNVVRVLKDAGLYRTIGRREDVKTYCEESVFLLILCGLSMKFHMSILKDYLKNES